MTIRADVVEAELSLVERGDVRWSLPSETPSCGAPDWRSLFERERARSEAAEARCGELRWAEVDSRARAGSLKWRLDTYRKKLKAVVEETKEVRCAAQDALSLQAEVARLEKLLSEAGVEAARGRTGASPSGEAARLRKALEGRKHTIESLRTERGGLRKEIGRRDKKVARLEDRLEREAQASETHRETIGSQGREVIGLHAELRRLRDQADAVRCLSEEVYRLRVVLETSEAAQEALKARLLRAVEAARSRPPSREAAELRKALRRSRRQKSTIKSLSKENARLRKAVRKSASRQAGLGVQLAKLRATGAVLSKALFGRRSERQERLRSERRRGRQPGAAGHGRTQRPALEERTRRAQPAADMLICAGCGKPYVANGARVSTLVEIVVAAHRRRIVRPRWRRRCNCASSLMEVSAPPAPRLFAGTPCGTSVWSRFLFERYACFRPLNRVAAWLSDQGLPISPGTLAGSARRFAPLFEPVAVAILARQNEAAVRHGDETAWRVQSLREEGRSSRAWLWTSVSEDAVYFHVDLSRGAEVAKALFAAAGLHTVIVCDRYSAYKEDGARTRWCSDSVLVLGASTPRLHSLRRRPGRANTVVPEMDRADRRDLPAERGASGPLRPRPRPAERGVRRGAGRAEESARRPVRGSRTGVGLLAGARARGQGATLAAEPSRGLERLRRPPADADGQQRRRARAEGTGDRETALVRLRQRDRRPVHGDDVLGPRYPRAGRHRPSPLAGGMAGGMCGERRPGA